LFLRAAHQALTVGTLLGGITVGVLFTLRYARYVSFLTLAFWVYPPIWLQVYFIK
jgi:hypothetical protein